jgi:hypothetical protein
MPKLLKGASNFLKYRLFLRVLSQRRKAKTTWHSVYSRESQFSMEMLEGCLNFLSPIFKLGEPI